MQNQEIVLISRNRDGIVIQGRNDVYDDTLENFAIDNGAAVPEFINELDRCWDTDHALLNDGAMTDEAEEYVASLLANVHSLCEEQRLRMNPEPTPEEIQQNELSKTIAEAQVYLDTTDYRILKFMDKQINENPELKIAFEKEYPDTLGKRQQARDVINLTQTQLSSLTGEVK